MFISASVGTETDYVDLYGSVNRTEACEENVKFVGRVPILLCLPVWYALVESKLFCCFDRPQVWWWKSSYIGGCIWWNNTFRVLGTIYDKNPHLSSAKNPMFMEEFAFVLCAKSHIFGLNPNFWVISNPFTSPCMIFIYCVIDYCLLVCN